MTDIHQRITLSTCFQYEYKYNLISLMASYGIGPKYTLREGTRSTVN